MLKTDNDVMTALTDVHQIKLIDETGDSHEYQKFYQSFQCQDELFKRGDTMYVKHFEDKEKLCILEILLIWEIKCHMFVSARVYYTPSDTCEGRCDEYGDQEVVCLQREVVMSCGEFLNHIKFTRDNITDEEKVKVVSYSAFCRQAAVKRRLGDGVKEYLSHPLFQAYGGIDPQYKILYCRDTVNDRDLKKLWKVQSYYRMKEMVLTDMTNKRQTKRQKLSESNDDSSDTYEEQQLCQAVEKEEDFLINLFTFLRRKGISISRLPTIGNKRVNLRDLFRSVLKLGGYEGVTSKRMWRKVFLEIGGSSNYTGATTSTRKQYERFLLPYELHLRRELSSPHISETQNEQLQTNGAPNVSPRSEAWVPPKQEPAPQPTKKIFTPRQIAPKSAHSKVPQSLLSNITNIKLPFNFIPSDATPDQLDILIRSLSENITRAKTTLQNADHLTTQQSDLGPMYRHHIQQFHATQPNPTQTQQSLHIPNLSNVLSNKNSRSYQPVPQSSLTTNKTGQVTQSTITALQNSILNSKKNQNNSETKRTPTLEEQLRELAAHLKGPEPKPLSVEQDITGQLAQTLSQSLLKSLTTEAPIGQQYPTISISNNLVRNSQSMLSVSMPNQINATDSASPQVATFNGSPSQTFNIPIPAANPSPPVVNVPQYSNTPQLPNAILQPIAPQKPGEDAQNQLTPELLKSLSKEELIDLIRAQGLLSNGNEKL